MYPILFFCTLWEIWTLVISKFPPSTGTQTFWKRQAENKSTLTSWVELEPGSLLPLLISQISPPFPADTIINRSTVLGKVRVRERRGRGMGERGGKRICKFPVHPSSSLYPLGNHTSDLCVNLLSSLDRMWGSCHHCFIVWGHVLCFCCMLLLLTKPAWFCG